MSTVMVLDAGPLSTKLTSGQECHSMEESERLRRRGDTEAEPAIFYCDWLAPLGHDYSDRWPWESGSASNWPRRPLGKES
eukprot:4296671-Amphidinium_carterae.1